MYERTAVSSGLVHVASDGEGLSVEGDKYTVELTPVGLQLADARPTTEQQAASSAHGFLHGLDAIHKVRSIAWVHCLHCQRVHYGAKHCIQQPPVCPHPTWF